MPLQPKATAKTPAKTKADQQNKRKSISNVAQLDAKNPIPFEPTGESVAFHFAGRKNRRYIPFLAPKDNFFQLILEAKLLSPTNNSCVNSKTDYCAGKGLILKDEKEDKDFEEWSKRVNKKGESLHKLINLAFNNKFTFGNIFLEVIRGKVGSLKFVKIMQRPVLDCRLAEADGDDTCQSVFVSKKFRTKNAWSLVDDQCVELPIYYGDDKMDWYLDPDQGTEHCIIHIKNDVPGYDYYGMPDNISSLSHQIAEYKGIRSNLDDFDNNMVVGGMVILEGNFTQEEADKASRDVIATHTGDGKRGRWAVLAGQKGITGSKIQSFDTKKDGSYIELDELAEGKIIDSNNWDKALFGQHKTSGLSNGGFAYLSAVYEIKKETVIEPEQTAMINDLLKPVFAIHDAWCGTKFSELDLMFKQMTPASFKGEIDVNKVLTKDEGREALGYPASEDTTAGKTFIDEQKVNNSNVPNKPTE